MKIQSLSKIGTKSELSATYRKIDLKKTAKFNPSIVHLEGNLYLVSYRVLVAKKSLRDKNKVIRFPTQMGAPWLSWEHALFDGVGLALLRYNPASKSFTVLKDRIQTRTNTFNDLRLYNVDGRLFATLNLVGESGLEKRRVEMSLVEFTYNKRTGLAKWGKPKVICPASHGALEKNWIWLPEQQRILYVLEPFTTFDYNFGNNTCSNLSKQMVFDKITHAYPAGSLFFSTSTPVASYKTGTLLSVGHVKVDFGRFTQQKDLPLYKFLNKVQRLYRLPANKSQWQLKRGIVHSRYFYFHILLELSRDGKHILRVSDAFIPTNRRSKTLLVFATGLSQIDCDTYVLSYGENDVSANFLFMQRVDIEQMLKHKPMMSAKRYDFKFLPAH